MPAVSCGRRCQYNSENFDYCQCGSIEIDENGYCTDFEEREEDGDADA